MENGLGFKFSEAKRLPIILLLDTSGSMFGESIDVLNSSVKSMLNDFASVDSNDVSIYVSIIKFGPDAQEVLPLMKAYEADKEFHELSADGGTPLGGALRLAKNNILENRNKITSRDYRPIVLLVSDGAPNDDWSVAFESFCNEGRSSKCTRMAVGIGTSKEDSTYQMLESFVTKDQKVYSANDAREIRAFFQLFSQTTTQRYSTVDKAKKESTGVTTYTEEDDDDIF